jgi:hypothetical protein
VWRKSTRTNGQGACVEVAHLDAVVGVRDSKNRTGPVLAFDPTDWRAFLTAVRAGYHDLS